MKCLLTSQMEHFTCLLALFHMSVWRGIQRKRLQKGGPLQDNPKTWLDEPCVCHVKSSQSVAEWGLLLVRGATPVGGQWRCCAVFGGASASLSWKDADWSAHTTTGFSRWIWESSDLKTWNFNIFLKSRVLENDGALRLLINFDSVYTLSVTCWLLLSCLSVSVCP